MNDNWKDFDRQAQRGFGLMLAMMGAWLLFLACAISAVIWGAGRLLGAW